MHNHSKDWRRPRRRPDSLDGAGDLPRTTMGHPVVSRHEALWERIRSDLRAHGSGALYPASAYRLQALYLDFGRTAPLEDLAESVLRAFDSAREGAGPAAASPPLEAGRESFGDLDAEVAARVGRRVARLSQRALTTVLAFHAHFRNVGLALEVVGGEEPLEQAGVGTCAFVAERRIGQDVGGDPRYYAPFRERREAFCSDHCLPTIGPRLGDDRPCLPPRTPVDCGMLKILEGFRFFASFPEE